MSKFKASKNWYLKALADEEGHDISAGPEIYPLVDPNIYHLEKKVYDVSQSFSIFIHKLRISSGYTIEDLAKKIDVEADQLVKAERPGYKLPPRTLTHIAKFYDLPMKPLLQLAGAVKITNPELEDQVMKFAAQSESFEKLTSEEKNLLNKLVKVIRDYTKARP